MISPCDSPLFPTEKNLNSAITIVNKQYLIILDFKRGMLLNALLVLETSFPIEKEGDNCNGILNGGRFNSCVRNDKNG